MAIYTNEHLTDLLNEQYARVRELETQVDVIKLNCDDWKEKYNELKNKMMRVINEN